MPQNTNQQLISARKLLGLGKPEEAKALLEPIVHANEPDPMALGLYVRICAQLECPQTALKQMEDLFEKHPENEKTWEFYLEMLIESGLFENAIKVGRLVARKFPSNFRFPQFIIDAHELNGDPVEAEIQLGKLMQKMPLTAELLEQQNRLSQAARNKKLVAAEVSEAADEARQSAPFIPTDSAFISEFLAQFAGREDVYSIQFQPKKGEWGYRPVHRALSDDLIKRHLAGDMTLGTYLVKKDSSSNLLVFDLDVTRAWVFRFEHDPIERKRIISLLRSEGAKLMALAGSIGLPLLVEFSGFKGFHFWSFSKPAIPAKQWRAVGAWLLSKIDRTPPEVHWELFPKQDIVDLNGLGNLVKIPLGIHRRSQKRSFFCDAKAFKPFQDQGAAFFGHPRLSLEQFQELLGKLAIENVVETARDEVALQASKEAAASAPPFDITPTTASPATDLNIKVKIPLPQRFPPSVEDLLAGCKVIWYIASRAMAKQILEALERHVLVYILSVLGEEGRVCLHQILNQSQGYSPDEVNRAIKAVPPNPMSCAKIRKNVPEIAKNVACDCHFRVLPGCYSSPVIYAGLVPSTALHAGPRGGLAQTPVPLSHNEEFIGASGEIDDLMREYNELKREMAITFEREKLLRGKINRLFDEAGTGHLVTKLGEYERLPEPFPK